MEREDFVGSLLAWDVLKIIENWEVMRMDQRTQLSITSIIVLAVESVLERSPTLA